MKRGALLGAALVVATLCAPRPALADDPAETSGPPSPRPSRTIERARGEAAAGRLLDARSTLILFEAGELDAAERFASAEVRSVLERWIAEGGIPRTKPDAQLPGEEVPPTGDDWMLALSRAKTQLAGGELARAERGLRALSVSAPDPQWASVATNLARLASAVAATHPVLAESEHPAVTDSAPEREGQPGEHWYGWETLMSDGLSLVTVPVVVGVGGYVLAVPIIHLAHGRPGAALGSLTIRLVAPIGLGFAGGYLGYSGGHGSLDTVVGGAALGFVSGVVTAIVIDASVLAYEPAAHDKPSVKTPTRGLNLLPTAAPRVGGGFDLGLGGTF